VAEEWRSRGAVDDAKMREYLLSPAHPLGRFKARVFASCGFSQERLEEFELAVLTHLREAALVTTTQTEFGVKRVLHGNLRDPEGQVLLLRSVWFETGEGEPLRLVTAYPARSS